MYFSKKEAQHFSSGVAISVLLGKRWVGCVGVNGEAPVLCDRGGVGVFPGTALDPAPTSVEPGFAAGVEAEAFAFSSWSRRPFAASNETSQAHKHMPEKTLCGIPTNCIRQTTTCDEKALFKHKKQQEHHQRSSTCFGRAVLPRTNGHVAN